MAYASGTFSAPFWAQSSPFNKGRDPLGIQNSSIVVFSRLLPGMTNLTRRIRYYGFYMWVLNEYHSQPDFKDSYKAQYQFIRRAELLLACIMRANEPDQTAVLGSDYTGRELQPDAALLDIAQGAKFHSDNSKAYWKYNSGAFGQYYLGSLTTLGLVDTLEGTYFFRLTEKGNALAKAYNANIFPAQRALFLSTVQSGMFSVPDARLLRDFSLSRDIRNTAEWQFYLDILMGNDPIAMDQVGVSVDFPALRRQSLKLFLEHTQRDPEQPEDLPRFHYQHKGWRYVSQESEAGYGWYYYQLNEYLHYALETVFWCLLARLEERKSRIWVDTFIQETVAVMEALFEKEGYVNLHTLTLDEAILLPGGQVGATGLVASIRQAVQEQEPERGLREAILLLMACYRENGQELPALKNYIQSAGLAQPGNAATLLEVLVISNLNLPVSNFFKALVSWVINDHLYTAYRKMGSSEDNVLKLIIEDGHIRNYGLVQPGFTSPRLNTLYRFMQDLKLVDADNRLTESGNLVLQVLDL